MSVVGTQAGGNSVDAPKRRDRWQEGKREGYKKQESSEYVIMTKSGGEVPCDPLRPSHDHTPLQVDTLAALNKCSSNPTAGPGVCTWRARTGPGRAH